MSSGCPIASFVVHNPKILVLFPLKNRWPNLRRYFQFSATSNKMNKLPVSTFLFPEDNLMKSICVKIRRYRKYILWYLKTCKTSSVLWKKSFKEKFFGILYWEANELYQWQKIASFVVQNFKILVFFPLQNKFEWKVLRCFIWEANEPQK